VRPRPKTTNSYPKSNKFNCAKSSPRKNKFVSSANMITFVRPDTLTRSLMYKRNRSGPRTDPCGTTQAIHYWRGLEARLHEAEARTPTRPRPRPAVTRPRPGFLASRPRPFRGLNIPGYDVACFGCLSSIFAKVVGATSSEGFL